MTIRVGLIAALFVAALWPPAHAADAAFQQWLAQQWPAAQTLGVSRATFDAATRGLEPDLSLTDLAIPVQPEKAPQQPEFVQTPSQYLREASFDRLATRGRQLATQYRDTLGRIEKEFGVPGNVVLAIWRVKPTMAAISCRTTLFACWQRRPMSASARNSSTMNFCMP